MELEDRLDYMLELKRLNCRLPDTKVCIECGEEKLLVEFPRSHSNLDGKGDVCSKCKYRAQSKKYYGKLKGDKDIYYMWAFFSIKDHRWKGFAVNLTYEELADIGRDTEVCAICGHKLLWNNSGKVDVHSPTVDRINNELIMTRNNIQIVCHSCNRRKGSTKMKEFIDYCERVVEYQKKNESNMV